MHGLCILGLEALLLRSDRSQRHCAVSKPANQSHPEHKLRPFPIFPSVNVRPRRARRACSLRDESKPVGERQEQDGHTNTSASDLRLQYRLQHLLHSKNWPGIAAMADKVHWQVLEGLTSSYLRFIRELTAAEDKTEAGKHYPSTKSCRSPLGDRQHPFHLLESSQDIEVAALEAAKSLFSSLRAILLRHDPVRQLEIAGGFEKVVADARASKPEVVPFRDLIRWYMNSCIRVCELCNQRGDASFSSSDSSMRPMAGPMAASRRHAQAPFQWQGPKLIVALLLVNAG